MERFKVIPAVHVILRRGDEILLGRREGSGYYDGHFHLPAGHGEEGESFLETAVREMAEELAIEVREDDLRYALVLHSVADGRINFFFETDRWQGSPRIAEPERCSELAWFPLSALPEKIVPYAAAALAAYRWEERFLVYRGD